MCSFLYSGSNVTINVSPVLGVMPLALELDHVCFQNVIVGLLVYTSPRPSLCIVCVVEHPYFIKIVKEK